MKKIILAILSVLRLVSCKQSEKKNDLTKENLKGKVKSIKETTYEAVEKFGQIEKGDVLYDRDFSFTIYDKNGNKIEKNYYFSDGLYSKYTYKYDKKGNTIEINNYNSNGSIHEKYTFKYDEKGNNIEQNNYKYDGSFLYKYTYKYDEKGNNIEKNNYDSNGRLDSKYTYEYDKNNNWTQRIEYKNTIPHRITERIIEYYP